MKPLSIIANIFLSVFVTLSGILYVVNHSANATYLQSAAKDAGIYESVSEVMTRKLTEVAVANSGQPKEQVEQSVSSLVSSEYIEAKSEEISAQIEQVLNGQSEKIVVDFSDLAAQASAQGLAVNSTDLKPIEITLPENTDTTVVKSAQNLTLLQFICYTLAIISLIASIVLGVLRRSTTGIGFAFLTSAIIFGGLSLLLHILKPVLRNLLVLPETVNEITPKLQELIRLILSDASSTYLLFAVILVILAVACFVLNKFIKKQPDTTKLAPITNPQKSEHP